ncbi:non-ribosomal peptide synthetase/type I polyketide synthase [Streptomyces sp. WMMC1477]|uniref:non-ribosomal peptide synthetase/type I polyketide synthase n=1 Tax=Streptomyces sp. WMMC1477 TaxID=3015155 RepID=UPI0022B617EA|nr:non-ribosomal peptide synthetase/type I polyketide synthase [Streptomyces sp. WMMC1477]MCZ7434491.1 amino acid adenylation domain-containing protein [Streptomyces sp. WMMC1477]
MTTPRFNEPSDAAAGVLDGGEIAVIGMAGRFPGASNVGEFWDNLRHGVESVTFFEDEELLARGVPAELLADPAYVKAGSLLEGVELFDAAFFGYNAREAALLDPQQRLLLETAHTALEDAGCVPSAVPGAIGIYAGSSLSTYLVSNLLAGRAGFSDVAETLELLVTNDKDYLASRVSYRLDLNGPAVAVQTACSSSLVALHLATQGLLAYDCDVALVGGASVRVPQGRGYLHREGMIFSEDGHTRPFDASGSGTMFGSGVGVVVLKRLADAIADRDRVDAVIRGTAVNNDGAAKIGYTAPGVDGQARVIATALGVADVDPDTVTAIEAHGTATPLGDPIEITALARAMGRSAGGASSCAIGSVKSNVGHLAEAAGITGLIKTVLQLRHRELAPSLHFERPNPRLDLDSGPFHIVTEPTEWKTDAVPRRIGVSSFGMGGTNAHAVLEEAPSLPPARPLTRDLYLLPLSARTPGALERATDELATALDGEAGRDPAAAATTLQRGRAAHPHRRLVVTRDAADAARALRDRDAERVATSRASEVPRVVLMFPGQGSQHPGMGAGLYRSEPVFREQIDLCSETLADELGLDLRELILPGPGADLHEAAARLRDTALAQPALFTVSYALAELLDSLGVRPDALIGHSVGEIVAACRAGVMSLRDALHLVAVRGRLMQALPPGGMLSVALPEDRVCAMLPADLSLAAVNGPELCVVSGPSAELDAFARQLADQQITGRELHTSHAFHSAMVEPMLEEFAAVVSGLDLHEPVVPYAANRTGTWATAAEATDPGHWARHVREPVRFGDGIRLVTEQGPTVLVEAGPGTVLSAMARPAARGRGATAVSCLPPARTEDGVRDEALRFTEALGRLWLAGAELDWERVQGGTGDRIALPTHPFERRRYWIEPAGTGERAAGPYEVEAPEQETADTAAPLSLSGDLDPRPPLTTPYTEPRDDRERRLAAIWQELLGVAPVGIHDNFMELGGHSLLAARVAERIKADLGTAVALRDLLADPTIAGLTALLGGDTPEKATDPRADGEQLPAAVPDPANLHEPFPLSEMQQAQWIGRMGSFQGGGVAAHVYWEVDLDEEVDVHRLESAWQKVVDRHDMLRAVIDDDGRQRILPDTGPYRFAVLDLRDAAAPESDRALADLRAELSHEIRPADRWPLFDIRVTLLAGGRTRLHLSFDLLIADIGSIRLLVRDWRRYYQGREEEIRPLRISYRDYVLASEEVRRTALYERSLSYWRDRVADLPPGPDLPLALNPAALTEPEFTARDAVVPTGAWNRFKERAAAAGVTPSAALLAAYAAALGTWAREPRFTLNVTVINRLPVHEDVRDLAGEFASFDLLPVDLADGPGFADLAAALQRQSWEDLEHRYLNGVEILREMARVRGGTSGSVMPVVFTSTLVQENEAEDASIFGWLGSVLHEIAQTPQVWLDFAVMETAEGVQLSWHWVRQLFPDGVMESVFDAFRVLVEKLADSDDAWRATAPCPLPADQRELIEAVNSTEGPVPEGLLYGPLMERAARHPDRTAVVASDRDLTFGQLRRHACVLAHRLRALGTGPGRLVAVAMEKGCEQVTAALAVQLAGGAYLPVDPDLPAERQDHLCERGQVRLVLTRPGGPERDWPEGVRAIEVDLDADPGDAPGADGTPPETVQTPADLAYVIFTSGSTGEPKGVVLSHRAALNTLVDVNERFGVGERDAVLGLSSLSFDLSVYDVFGVLGAGGRLVLPRPGTSRDPGHWDELVRRHGVTLWNSVPALMQMYVEHLSGTERGDGPPPLRLALLSGDWIPLDLPARLRELVPDLRPVSLGGATEAAVWSIFHPIDPAVASDPEWDSVPYGTPLRNQTFHVLDAGMRPCPVWAVGELYIGGVGVAEGYWRDEERTAASFVTHPATGERLYRTGDLGRRRPDGTIEFLGREDFQVKVGGFRIELGEIEAALLRHDGVREAAVAAPGDRHNRRLVAYVVPGTPGAERTPEGDQDLADDVRALAEGVLPAYMVPAAFVVLDRLPLSSNGKVDRSALPDPTAATAGGGGEAGPLAVRLAEIVAEVVGTPGIGPRDNFFSVGGNSIMGIQVVSRATAEGLEFSAADLFQQDTIADLAALLEARGTDLGGTGTTAALTPRQAQLLAADVAPRSVHRAELTVGQDLEPAALEAALAAVVAARPALRTRLVEQEDGWARRTAPADGEETAGETSVPLIDLGSLPEAGREAALEQMAAEMREELCPVRGPVTKAALFDLGTGTRRLLWLVHEAAVDGPSWPALLADLAHAADRAARGEEAACDAEDPDALRRLTGSAGAPALRTDASGPDPGRASHAPAPLALGEGDTLHRLGAELTPQETADLLDGTAAAYRLTAAETLAAALTLALGVLETPDAVRADLEHDPRTADSAHAGDARAVGSLAVLRSVDLDAATEPGAALVAAKEACRAAPPERTAEDAGVLLRHLGTMTAPAGALAPLHPPVTEGGHPLAVTTQITQARLSLTVACRSGETPPDGLPRLVDALVDALRRIADHCRTPGAGSLSPSDFPLSGLDADELTAFVDAFGADGGDGPDPDSTQAHAEETR